MNVTVRIGHGYDVHRLEPGEGVTLGGVFIACAHRIIAHSDGDVLIHALCDALLGAAALGDIGHLFPDTDARFKDVDSRELLREVVRRLHAEGYRVGNADLTLIAQTPKVAPYVATMRERLAADLAVPVSQVNVKATTHEGLDAIGEQRGLAAHAVALVMNGRARREGRRGRNPYPD